MSKVAIIVSQFNPEVTHGLLAGARAFLKEKGIEPTEKDIFDAPGAFEIPLLAQKLAKTHVYQGIVCLGCVIKGDTAHFEFISLGATLGLVQANLSTEIPITFGILTTYSDEQAKERSRLGHPENKGREAAAACFESMEILKRIEQIKRK